MSRPSKREPTAASARARAVLPVIRAYLPSLRNADARVANVILEQPQLVISRSAAEVADMANTSGATVVRCAQQLGFKGYQDLRHALADEIAATQWLSDLADNEDSGDPDAVLLRKVAEAGAASIREVATLVDLDAFRAAADALSKARSILFVGVGTSYALCHDAAFRFTLNGLSAEAPADVLAQHTKAHLLTSDDVCVTLSWTGQTRDSVAATRSAAAAGATTIAITSFAKSALTEVVDHTLVAGTRDVNADLASLASRLALLAMLDCLLAAVTSRIPERVRETNAGILDAMMDHYL